MNQHYVPKVYLKNFASKSKGKGKGKEYFVDVYDKVENRFFQTNTKKICAEIDFYTLDEDTVMKDVMAIEKVYSDIIEPLYESAYKILADDKIFHIRDEHRAKIILAVVQFYYRNPAILKLSLAEHRRAASSLISEAKHNSVKGVTYFEEDYSFRDYSEDQIIEEVSQQIIRFYKERHIIEIQKMAEFHVGAILEVATIEDESEFFACDNPFVSKDLLSDDWDPLQKSKEFILPLDKKHFLKIYHDNTKDPKKIYRLFIPGGSVTLINETIVENSQRFVIASKKAFEYYTNTKEILDDTSLEAKVNWLRQIAELTKDRDEHPKTKKLIFDMLEKYERTGEWTPQEQWEFMRESNKFFKEYVKQKIE